MHTYDSFLKPCKSNNWIIVNEVSKETIGITQHFAKNYISLSQWLLILSAFKLKKANIVNYRVYAIYDMTET